MTGKEALQRIKDFKVVLSNRSDDYESFNPIPLYYDKELKIIEKDLEVMEILKKVDWLVYNNGDKNDFNWYIDTNKSMKITKEAGRIKGWLNDK